MRYVEYGFSVEKKGETPSLINQVHGAEVVELVSSEDPPEDADGVYTLNPSIELHVFTADCLPLVFFGAEETDPIAAVHCGWRGAKLGIVRRAVELLQPITRDLHVAIGPGILGCCFEVKQDFVDEFQKANRPIKKYIEKRAGKLFCDIARYVTEVELKGVFTKNIHTEELRCTFCTGLPSYRRDKGTDPRIKGWIRNRAASAT